MTDATERKIAAVSELVDKEMSSLEKRMRPMQKDAFLCSANCCDTASGPEEMQTCIQSCTEKVQKFEQIMTQSLGHFQGMLQGCATDCQQNAVRGLSENSSEKDIAKAQEGMIGCIGNCADHFGKQVPNLVKGIDESLRANGMDGGKKGWF
mmetsp:Transcript_34663/g.109472  ORF Transcript_34663/g.109472 Transcript_34663/m.109472 type:complete len:151 (+) Transcript_34663:25-477(+)